MKRALFKAFAFLSVLPVLLPTPVSAQLDRAQGVLEETGVGPTGEAGGNLPVLIGNLINIFIGVLGLIFVVLVVYAGYMYLTAGGEPKKVERAKRLLGQAVIGIIIVLAAYAISNFVVGALGEGIAGNSGNQQQNSSQQP